MTRTDTPSAPVAAPNAAESDDGDDDLWKSTDDVDEFEKAEA